MFLEYQVDKPFVVGQESTVKITNCPEGYIVTWFEDKPNTVQFVSGTFGNPATIIPLSEQAQLRVKCCDRS